MQTQFTVGVIPIPIIPEHWRDAAFTSAYVGVEGAAIRMRTGGLKPSIGVGLTLASGGVYSIDRRRALTTFVVSGESGATAIVTVELV